MNEFELIEKYLKPLTKNHPAALSLTDDAAVITPRLDKQVVVSCDCMSEGVHFLPSASAEFIAKKLVGCNLSDQAAMGAMPQYALISATLPRNFSESWVHEFCQTLNHLNEKYNICLIGGDTVRHDGPLTLSMTVVGEISKYKAITRSGAEVGDNLYVTGNIGDAAIGLRVARDNDFSLERMIKIYFIDKYYAPQPRVEIGNKLIGSASAMIDISDGFVQDIGHIAKNSHVMIEIDLEKIPYSDHLKSLMKDHDLVEEALTGGDDYELAFTAPKAFHNQVLAIARSTNTQVTQIGVVKAGKGVKLFDANRKEVTYKKTGWQH